MVRIWGLSGQGIGDLGLTIDLTNTIMHSLEIDIKLKSSSLGLGTQFRLEIFTCQSCQCIKNLLLNQYFHFVCLNYNEDV